MEDYVSQRRGLVDRTLELNLPPPNTPPRVIHEAMRYAVLGGGKRIRPILALAAAEACGAEIEPLLVPCAALELIHTYSLVHDDLPALDDDDLRRGRKTTHVVYGEAMGILTGDALLTEAFSWLSRPLAGVEPRAQLEAIQLVAQAIDSTGMIGGQVADLESAGVSPEGEEARERLLFIHRKKTGKLIAASVMLGGVLAGADPLRMSALQVYGESIGLAFQIVDDLLDREESSAALGKTAGKDLQQGKLTYPAVMGAEAAREELSRLLEAAEENAGVVAGTANHLGELARYLGARRR